MFAWIAAATSAAVMLRAAIRTGSSHSRIAKVWPPRMSAEATLVDRIEQRLRRRGSGNPRIAALCSVGLAKPIYMTAVVCPVALMTTGSCDPLRHQVFDLLHLGDDVGERGARVVIELDVQAVIVLVLSTEFEVR